uniref:Microtubule actin crosslinking factor 1 n=1 Tax=Cyprinus carpio TaxID=7962 RepID=A0A8C1JHJ0_CYPCA
KHLIKVRKHITDLYEDLRDGHNLISLLEVLSGVTLPREKGRMRFHQLQNVQIALDFLKQRQVKLVNIRNDDITDGNPKLTLGLIWTIILHFQISEIYVSGESGDLTAKEKLLLWSQQATEGYRGLRCTNFSSSWSDGRLFNALLHRYRPDLIDMEVVAQQSNRENLEQAFEIAESLGVTRLLDAEDVDVPLPDEKSVITYVSSIYDAFPKIPEGGEGIAANEVDQRWTEYQSGFSSLLQWTRQHTALMTNRSFPHNPVELKALYNEYVHFKETEIPAKEREKSHIEHLYKLLEAWIEFGRIKLPQGLHPNDLEEEWGKLILEMLEREKALRPAVERLVLLVCCLDIHHSEMFCDMSHLESGQPVRCENELGMYLQDCEALVRQLHLDLQVLRDEKYYQVEQLVFRVSCLQEELVSLRLQCASVYRKGHFSTGGLLGEHAGQKGSSGRLATLGAQTLLGAVGAAASLLRRPMSRADLVAMSSSEDEGSLRFIYELLGWVDETQELLERAEWGSDLPSVDQHLQDHHIIHTAVEDLLNSLKEARNYESRVSPNLSSSYSETLSKLENQYCKLLEHSSWRLRCLESLRAFVSHCTEELIWLNEREEEELAFDWSDSNTNMAAKRESELEEKQEVMHSLQETADQLCQENHPAKQTVEAYSAALQTQWQWIKELCICVEQHLKDNTAYFQFMSDARDCESYLRQLQDTIKRQYTCDKNSRLGRLEDMLQDSMEEKEQLIEYRSTVASLVGRAKSVVQLRPRSADSNLGTTTPIRAICDYRQIEITISKGEECVLEDNSQRTKWKVISPTGNEAMVPSVCFTIPPPNQEAIDTASRMEQMYQNVMSLWHQLHVNMKSVVSWHYLQKDIRNISSWSLDTMRLQAPAERQQALDNLDAHLSDFLTDSHESSLFTPTECRELERETENCRERCQTLQVSLETVERDELASRAYLSELRSIKSHLEDAESRLMRGIQTPHPSTISGDITDNAVHIAEQEKLQQDLKGLQSDLGEVSRRCVSFFEEKPSSSSVPVLRSELNLAVEHIEKLNSLSSVYLQKLKTVDVLTRSLQAAESQVRKYESRLSEEDIVPADTAAIQALGEQLKVRHLEEQDHIFKSLSLEVQQAREVRNHLNQLHPDRSPEQDRYQEKAQQLTERWSGVSRQMETRQADLEMLGSVLQQYREGHTSLIHWIEETTKKQENTQPEQTDSRALSEQLAQQTALVAEIEQNQVKLDECQTYSKQYCAAVKDYELQLMTFRAFVESTQKSPVKRRRMHSSSDVITQEFMDLRTRYTALVTLTTQHVKYISDALRRLEEEEVCYAFLSLLLSVLIFTYCILAQVVSQLDELTATYTQLCDSSAAQLQQLEEQQAKEEKQVIAGVIDLGTMETFPVFQAAQCGLIDQDTCHVLLEAQVVMGGLFQYDSPDKLSLDKGLSSGLIDKHTYQSLEELETALGLVNTVKFAEGQELPVATAMREGVIKELVGLRILELQISTGSLKFGSNGEMVSLDNTREKGLLSPDLCQKLQSCLQRRELIDPNTAEKLSLVDFQQRCVVNQETGLRFFPVKQKPGGTVCLCSGRKVGIFCAVQEGLIDRHVTVRLLEAQLFAGGITDPRSGHRLTVNEAVRHGLMDQDLACTLMTRQLQAGGIIDPVSGERLELDEAIKRDLLSPRIALRVLESLQSFMEIMWPESGELLPISEALQQGVVNRELAAKALRKRHSVGAVYLPESGQVVPLNQADKILKPQAVEVLKQIQVPDVLPNVSKSSFSYMKRLSSGSAYSSSPPASHADVNYDFSIMEEGRSEEQVQCHLLTQVMTHSYIDAHSGERLVLLEPELVELICENVKTTNLVRPVQHKISDNIASLDSKAISGIEEEEHEEPKIIQYEIKDFPHLASKDRPFKVPSHKENCQEKVLSPGGHEKPKVLKGKIAWTNTDVTETVERVEEDLAPLAGTARAFIVPLHKEYLQEQVLSSGQYKEPKSKKDETVRKKTSIGETLERPEEDVVALTNEKLYPSERKTLSVELSNDDDVKLGSMAMDLQQGGLVTVGGQKVLLDEALAQGLLPGHTAIKLMEKAGFFGGFLDIKTCKSLSVGDVMQEGLLDEDLMAYVLHSEKILAGVIDVDHGRLCSVKEAAEAGLLESDTAARLLEAQVVSGGIVDLQRDKKVSVTLAANLGLIEEGMKEKLLSLEKSCRRKCSDQNAVQNKLALQLQMKGVVDPKTKKPVPLEQALQTGLIGQDEAQMILCQQVAEGGIVHHGSGVRLAVVDALHLGLIDHTVAPKLMELEKAFKGQEPCRLDQDTSFLQASTGSIYDDVSKSRITLSEAVSKGLLDDETANKAMASPNVKSGLLDPHKACVVSYSELINQGKIDIETGQRFLEVRPFRGVPHKQTDEMMTLPQAIKACQVDPIPAVRVLQSQADTGGIINIYSGERLLLPEAINKGLIDKDMAKSIATNQLNLKGGLLSPSSGQRVSSITEAVEYGLISTEMAAELQHSTGLVDEDEWKSSKIPASSTKGPSSSFFPGMISERVSPNKMSLEKSLLKKVIEVQLSETSHASGILTSVTGSDETAQGKYLEIGVDRTPNKTKTSKHESDHESNARQKEKTLTQHSVTTSMAKTDQGQEAIEVSKDLATDISEKKRKKKSKSKKVKQVCIVEAEGVQKKDDETEKEHKTVIHEVEPQSSQSDEKDSMKQLEKANQAMAQKEILLMKAKESIQQEEDRHDKHTNTGLSGDYMDWNIPSMKTSDDIVDINQKELVLIQNLEGETKERTAEEQSIEPLYTDEMLIDPMSEVTLPSSTAVTDSHEVAKSVPLKCVLDIPAVKDPKALPSSELCTPLQNTQTASSLARQECLEHDQQIVALLSMVRHVEVRLKQQQQQSVGRGLATIDDIIKQTEMLFLEISDLEPEVHKETEAATQLLESSPQDVPPQLLTALEKDGRSLARAHSAARDLAQNTLQGLRAQRDLQRWHLSHSRSFFSLQKLQNSLAARSNEVSNVAFSIQVFISEHAQDLLPDQSRHLLGQLEQLQRVFHQAVGLNHARAEALSAQQARENEQMRKEQKENEEKMEKERQTARDREAKRELLYETIHSVEEFLSERGDSLSPEERAKLQGTLSQMKEQHSSLTNSVRSSLAKVDTAITELQQLQAQQAHLQQVAQSVRSLLEQPDSSVPPEEKQRLQAKLEQLQNQHQEHLQNCQDRLRRAEALRDEFAKFVQEHGNLGTWLDQSEQELRSLGEGETDAKEDVICHKADLRFVTISGQKVLDSIQGALEKVGSTDPALEETRHLVSGKLQDATQRYSSLHSKVELRTRLSGLLERYQHYQDEAGSLISWMSTQEQNQSFPYIIINHLFLSSAVFSQLMQDELAERSVQLEKVKRAGNELVNTQESPTLKNADINNLTDTLEKRFEILSNSVSVRAEQLQTAVAQSVSVQEGLKALLAWLDGLPLSPGAVQATAQAVQDALTQNQLLSRQGSVDATLDSVSKLLKSADASTASGLQGALQDLSERYTAAQAKQAERETELRGLLPKLESFERQSADLRSFTQSRERALSPVGQPDCSVDDYRQTIEVSELEITQESSQLESFVELGSDLSQSGILSNVQSLLDTTKESCVQQLAEFRSRSGSLLRWLQTAQEQLPAKEPNLSTESLQRRAQQLKDLLTEWETQGSQVQELNKTSSQLENLIINITSPKKKAGRQNNIVDVHGQSSFISVNGIHTCKDLTEIQVAVADVNCKYEQLGSDLRERKGRQEASLDLRQKARQGTEALIQWLSPREQSLEQGQTTSPSRPEVVRAQAQETKVLLSELAEHSGKVEDLKNILKQLITDNPDSPEAETWKRQLEDIDSRWTKANQTAAQKQTELEVCADRLGSFAAAASQLGPWLREKELMMSVLGPLSIDPNMLNTQKQQVQFMLREFETRQPQFDQLTRAAEGILSPTGDESSRDGQDLEEVRQELADISQQWEDLTSRLTGRSQQIDQAQGTSERYLALLRQLSQSVADLGERLDAQASLSAQPEALRRRLQETGEIRAELEQRRGQLAQAEQLCLELSTIVAEPYLRDELHKRLESVSGPLKNLEERAADGLSQLQAALSSTQQFQQMFDELRGWLDGQAGNHTAGDSATLPCQPDALKTLLAQQEDLQRAIAQQRGSYELIQAEGTSLLASLPAGDERLALQTRLNTIRQDWEGMNQQTSNKHSRIKETLSRAELYQQHRNELVPWVAECEEREAEIHPSLDPSALDQALQKARQLSLDLDRRRRLLDSLNKAADQLLEQSCTGEEEVMDEKAQLNRRIEGLSERLQGRTAQLEELGSRLKEFEDGRLVVERRLEAARHQIEVQEALGPQACSNKSLERLRSQQELLNSVQPQVVYLQNLAQGLLQDAPEISRAGEDGGQRLLQQARDTEREFEEVTEKVRESQCCLSLESRLQGVGEVQSRVRDVFSRLADLDDELDSLSPVGRDTDSLASQADAVRGFLSRLGALRAELESHGGECTTMLRREGSSPDLLALRRETEALSRQAGKLAERGQNRLSLIEAAEERMKEFYTRLADLQGLLGRAEEVLNTQAVVGTEVEVIKQQLQEFKVGKEEQIDSIQPKLQHVNAVGQGLIQSAAKHTDTQGLEHDLETTNLRWNSINKRVAERIAQLQEALLHCGKFQDALEPLLSWLSDTEELIANQKPPSAEYRVVKAQIQEQKLLQRLLDDRLGTVEMIRAEGERIASTAETQDRDKIQKHLKSLEERWTNLLEKASARQQQLEELQVLALQFHEAVEPLGEWLSATERRLSSAEPMGTQTSKITQQIVRHKALNEEIISRKKTVDQAIKNGQALLKQTTGEEVLLIQEKLDGIKSRYAEMTAGSSKALRTLEQALQLATRFASSHNDISQWLDSVEAELNNIEPDTTPAYQDRQRELKCVSAEKRLVLDTVNEVGSALLDLVPWRAREGLDRLVADANQRYRQADETITQRVQLVQAAIQRSQQYEEAVDAELTWVGETERKLASLGPLSLEPDVTVAQLQVQRAFNIDIIRHKDTVDQLLKTREDILESCSEQQREALKVKTDSLSACYEAVNQSHAERFSALEQAQVLVARFWETYEELEPWLGETETLITQQPPPAIDTEALRQQQDQMRLLRESISEHKPHIDKLLKIGPQLAELSAQEGATLRQRYNEAERRYLNIKEEVKSRATALDEAVSQSVQFHDKMDPLLETLEGAVQRLRQPPPVAAEVEKIREQLAEHRATGLELDKLLPSFSALCARGEELIGRAPHDDPAAQAVHSRLLRLRSLWDEIRQRAEEREGKLQDVLDLSGKFWADMAALLSTLRDSQDIVKDLEDPGVDPSLIKQQIEAAEAIKQETDGLREELEIVRTLGADLIFACGEIEKPEVKKTIDEMNAAWEGLNRTWRERMERLEEAMTASVQYQDALQGMFDYLDNAVIKLCDMPAVGTDLSTVKQQIEELKQYKVEVYQQQIDMEKLCHQGELLLKKVSDQTDRDMIQEPLTELRHLWDNLVDKITIRQHKLEGALLALGQFQHALSELQSWLSHTYATLDTQRPISSDPKAIEIELAKHHVLRNDVLSHRATVETVNSAGSELLESSPGDEINHLRDQLDELNRSWKNLLLKTDERQKLLEAALQQAEGFHGELEEFLLWLRRTESQLSAAKPTGGLPETAREQLQQHMELEAQLTQRSEQYHRLLDQGESILLARGGDDAGPGTTQTQQNLALLQNKWASFNTKMDDRRDKLEEAVSLATGFQTSLQDTINWLTQSEQTLNMAQPPSLILDTVLFQIDEHKVFVNEVNTHREQVLALEKAGSQLRFASLKQDVVLIKNLLLSVQARWDKLVQRSLDRGRHLDEARKRAKQFHEAWRKLTDWLEEAESRLDSELEISNEPDKIKIQLAKHKDFQKSLGSKQPVYDTTVRSGKAMRDKATLPADTQKLDNLLGEVRDKWDTVCGKSVERQHKLEEALLFSGQFAEALQALVDWLYRVEPQLAEDQPVHGDLDLVSNLMDSHKVFQKELGKRTSSVQALKRSARELMETGRDDTAWVKVQLQELSNRWETVCALSVSKQTRLQQALKQAEEFRTAVQMLLEWLSEAEQTLRFRGVLPEEVETLQALLHTHRDFMQTVEEKRVDVNKAAGMGEAILAVCHPDCITTIKHWITIIRARFEEVLTWAKQHEQRLETALTELLNNATLLEELLSWLQWAETTLVQRDTEPLPQDITQLKTLITEHQVFMEEMTRKQPDVDKVTKTYKRKPAEHPSSLSDRRGARKRLYPHQQQQQQHSVQVTGGNPRLTQLCSHWQQVWLLALDRQRKLNDALDRLEELKEFANFDFDVWRKKYMRWMNHKKSRVMDFFRRIDKDQDGKITRQEFIDGILASKFPTSRLEMTAVADIFDRDCDGYIDYYEFVAALHPNKDAYRPTTDADKIEDEVTRQVAQCKCAKRFQVEQIGENKYRFFLGNQFGDSQQLRLVRILRSTVMVRVGGGWMALDEFLVKNDPCRARGRTNLELREKFILPEGLTAFRSRGRRSKPSSRTASPTRSSSSASHSAHSCASLPSAPATPTASSRGGSTSKLKRPTFHSSRGSLTGENGGTPTAAKPGHTKRTPSSTSGPASRAGSRAGSRTSSRRGSDASDTSELMETRSACSDTSDTPRRPGAKPSKIPTISKKAPSPKTPAAKK